MKMGAAAGDTFRVVLGIVTVLAFVGSARAQTEKAAQGPCGSLFGEKVCTSYRTRAGKVTEFILSVPVAAIKGAPAKVPMVWPPQPKVNVPFAPVVQKQTGFLYANVYWEANGHPPGAYMVPHFDFHFYIEPEKEVQEIDCKDTSKPRSLPAGYSLPDVNVPHLGELAGLCVPVMGMHAVPDKDLKSKTPWDASLLVGYYSGKPIFIEPMITRAYLLGKRSFSLAVPEIGRTPHVRYPRRFRAVYLPKSKTYDFIFSY
jgi:hypothetical protein